MACIAVQIKGRSDGPKMDGDVDRMGQLIRMEGVWIAVVAQADLLLLPERGRRPISFAGGATAENALDAMVDERFPVAIVSWYGTNCQASGSKPADAQRRFSAHLPHLQGLLWSMAQCAIGVAGCGPMFQPSAPSDASAISMLHLHSPIR